MTAARAVTPDTGDAPSTGDGDGGGGEGDDERGLQGLLATCHVVHVCSVRTATTIIPFPRRILMPALTSAAHDDTRSAPSVSWSARPGQRGALFFSKSRYDLPEGLVIHLDSTMVRARGRARNCAS
jgi:hypothetical protein